MPPTVSRRLATVVLGPGWRRISLAGLLVLVALVPATGRDRPGAIQALAPVEEVAAGFREPAGVVVDEAGALYLSDRKAGTVTRLSPDGHPTILVRGLKEPRGLAFDRSGRLLIAEGGRDRILRALGVLVSGIKDPRWLAVAEDGGLYISARRWHREHRSGDEDEEEDDEDVILRLGTGGGLSVVADGFTGLQGFAVHDQALYAVSQRRRGEDRQQGSNLVRFPIQPDGSLGPMEVLVRGQLRNPTGLAVDGLGGVFVTAERLQGGQEGDGDERHQNGDDDEDANGVIVKWRPDGRLVTFATGLEEPQGLAFEAPGHLLVADGRRLLRFHAPAPPTFGIPPFTNQAVFTVHGKTEPHARLDLFLNGAASPLTATADAAGAFSLLVPLALDTENEIAIVATAHGGDGLSSAAAQARLTQDGTGPSLVFQSPPAGVFVRGDVPVQARASDGGSGVSSLTLQADGQALAATLSPPPPAPSITATATLKTAMLPDGDRTLMAVATDGAGNSQQAARVVTVDNTPPETELTGGPGGEISQTSATFTFGGTDNLTPPGSLVFAWQLDGGGFTGFSPGTTATVSGLAAGPHTFEVKARDLAGNEDPTPATREFAVRLGPTISRVDPDRGTIGALITIHGGGFEPGATQATFNGTAATIRTITAATITTTVPPGATTGVLAVTTSRGTASRPFTVLTTQDFAIQVVPADGEVLQGASTTYTVELVSLGVTPFTGLATLAVEGLPSGVTATFGSPTLTGGQRGTLTLSASASAAAGASSFTIRATAPGETGTLTRGAAAGLTVLAGGRTALVGQVVFVDGRPIPGVKLMLGGLEVPFREVFSDAGGNFQILEPPPGTYMLGIDANVAQAGLPIYGVDVTLTAGQVTQLPPFRITPPPPPERFTPIDNATADQVITDARFPGVSITLPAGVTIIGWDGVPKTRIAIERLTPDRLPVPPPPGPTRSLYQIYFGTPMGGLPSAPLPVTVPNDQEADPGEQVEIWYYDAAPFGGVPAAWRMAGLGQVSDDGTRVVSNPGVGLQRFCGVCGLFCFIRRQGGQPNRNPDGSEEGDPVNLALGQVIVAKTDLVLPGRVPAQIHRTYNPLEPFGRIAGFELGLGPGWALSTDVVLQDENLTFPFFPVRRLILPGNARFAFQQQPDGSFVNTTHVRFDGAVLTQNPADGTHRLRFKDGTTWKFGPTFIFGLNLLVEQADRNGNRLTIERDFRGRPTRVFEPGGRALIFTPDPFTGRIGQVSDPVGRTVRYGYDTSTFPYRLERVTDPTGGVTRYTYTADGGLLTITDPRGLVYLSHEYDAQGRVVRQTQADGGVWRFAYEGPVGAHTRVTVTDPLGHVTTHRMDNGGFASEVVNALGQPTRQERDARGLVTAATDPLGRVTRFEYDTAGNVTRTIDPAGQVRTFAYEPTFNRVSSVTDPLGQVTRFEYDALGNLTATVDPLGNRTTIAYNVFGQPVSRTDPLGNTTRFEYDARGNLTTIVDPLGNTTRREYDAASRLVRQIDPRGRPTVFTQDALNRLTQLTDPARGVTRFGYDANGNLLTVTDARGSVTSYTYDVMDRLATRTDPVGAVERFEYDRGGNLVRHIDRKAQVADFRYDALNRRVGGSYAEGTTTSLVYDAGGRLVQGADSVGGTIANQHDLLDRVLAQATQLGTVSYRYDALGRRTRMDLPGQASVFYEYDASSRFTQIVQGSQVVDFQYDALGRRTRLTLPNQVSTEYQYDAASRLTALIYRNALGILGDLTYQYDRAGNRTRVGGSFATTLLPDPVNTATYDTASRQLAFGDKSMSFDANGNLAAMTDSSGLTTFTWDARNRLIGLASPDSTAGFVYDPLGRRLSKQLDTQLTQYLYDGGDIVQELPGGAPLSYLRSLNVDEPLVRNGSEHYLADALGSILALADTSGAVGTRYRYAPFGQATGDPTSTNPIQYTGRENDGTGLYFYRARYYQPGLHRFISEDPLDLSEVLLLKQAQPADDYAALLYWTSHLDPELLNPFVYVADNPTTYTDPTGEIAPQLVACAIGAGVSIGLDVLSGHKISWADAAIGCVTSALGLRLMAELSKLPYLRFLNQNPFLRIGPGRFGGETGVPSVRIGPSPWNQGKSWTHWRLYP